MSLKVSGYRVLPLDTDDENPVSIDEHKILLISQKSYNELKAKNAFLQKAFNKWVVHREDVVLKVLEECAVKLDDTQFGTNIANVAGGGVGILGGAGVIGGFFFPPLLIPGIVAVALSATNGATTGITKAIITKVYGDRVNEVVKKDSELLELAVEALKAFQEAVEKMANEEFVRALKMVSTFGLKKEIDANRTGLQIASDVMSGLQAVPAVAVALARTLIRTTVSSSTNVLKGASYVFGGIGIALDLATTITTTVDMAKGSRCELSKKVREVASELKKQKIKMENQFNSYIDG